jgi:hypothetical protein
MYLVNDDLNDINFRFLMVVRECARHHPLDAIWKFNLSAVDLEKISAMSIDELKEMATCNRAVLTLLPFTANDMPSSILAALLPMTAA